MKQVLLLLLLLTATLLSTQPLQAQTVISDSAGADFPETVTFSLKLAEPVAAATLLYSVDSLSCVDSSNRVPIEGGASDSFEWVWIMRRSGNPPPGTTIRWQWQLTDHNGNVSLTPMQSFVLQDTRFEWRSVRSDRIILHWYAGDSVGPLLLDASEAALTRLEQEIGVELEQPVTLWIYGSAAEMREALLFVRDWAGGVAIVRYNTILIGVEPSRAESWGVRTVAHELAHLVIGQDGFSCVGGTRPTWLEEGLAMVAEGEPESATLQELERAIADDSFAPLRSLTGAFPAHDSNARLAYSQSYSVASFLLETYGAQKVDALIEQLASGSGYDDALTAVYGFNMDALETAWRQAIGANRRAVQPTRTPIAAAAVPTYAPVPAAVDVATPSPVAEQPPGKTAYGCTLGLLLAVAAVAVGGYGGAPRRRLRIRREDNSNSGQKG